MSRAGMIHLLHANGGEIWIRPEHVSAIVPESGPHAPTRSLIHLVGGETLLVRGTPDQVSQRMGQ